jgi:prepilin signal peptidase PulO-like enzyme (type II secretory pathway)
MIYIALILLGLCFGSFINALVWRIHEQAKPKGKRAASDKELSISTGRSMCPHCKHTLAASDLVPFFSWLILRGKCRYCHHKIDDTPITEVVLPILFVLSYAYWPLGFTVGGIVLFAIWLVVLVMLTALMLYDFRWMLLPNRIVYPLIGVSVVFALAKALYFGDGPSFLVQVAFSVLIAGGIFYVLFQLSGGKWIGGGDVKLGYGLGLLLMSPAKAILMLFTASLLGLLVTAPLLLAGKAKVSSRIPFGPFLILATIIVFLIGTEIINWYTRQFLFL